MGVSSGRRAASVLFVNGFHRSGTTVVTSAVTEAVGGVTTTVGTLARHLPALAELLAGGGEQLDRGVDRLAVTAETPEEYGYLLKARLGVRGLYDHPDAVGVLQAHIVELALTAPGAPVVLKNPWDLGHEVQVLQDFPDAGVILLRRRLADIERSVMQALLRATTSPYAEALEGEAGQSRFQVDIASPWRRHALLGIYRLGVRRRAHALAGSVRQLPLDRVALLSYDELRADPRAAAQWAGHLLDAERLAAAFSAHAFRDAAPPAPSTPVHRALDARWRGAWTELRAAQLQAGILEGTAGRRRATPPRRIRLRPATAPSTSSEPHPERHASRSSR